MDNPLQKFKDAVSNAAHGMTKGEAHAKGVCVMCKEDWKPKTRSPAGQKEYQISGMCEECWDALFAGDDDERDAPTSR